MTSKDIKNSSFYKIKKNFEFWRNNWWKKNKKKLSDLRICFIVDFWGNKAKYITIYARQINKRLIWCRWDFNGNIGRCFLAEFIGKPEYSTSRNYPSNGASAYPGGTEDREDSRGSRYGDKGQPRYGRQFPLATNSTCCLSALSKG